MSNETESILDLQIEVIQASIYCDIIKRLLLQHRSVSIVKVIVYPLIPFLVVDHISKPFDTKNQMALGVVLHAIYEDISKEQLQIILFDDKEPSELGITPDRATSLLLDGKSGFNPFYSPVIASQEDSPDEE